MGKTVLMSGARVAASADHAFEKHLWLDNGRISFFADSGMRSTAVDVRGYLVLPGLINAHDHLELNLLPRLGRGAYVNATAWAREVYRPHEPPVQQHTSIPKYSRLLWGGLKNLVSGVTTVAHHNDPHPALFAEGFPVRVLRHYGWAHSLHFSADWAMRFRRTPVNVPFMIHAAEGTDDEARREVYALDEAGALGPSTVLIHAVGVGSHELRLLLRRRAAVVWCPSSNHFTLGRSLSEEVLQSRVPIALATDSAMTAEGDLLDELRFAHQTVDAARLYAMVTSAAAQILRLPWGYGDISQGGPADLLLLPDHGETPARTLLCSLPALVILGGRIVLASEEFASKRLDPELRPQHSITVQNRGRYLVPFPVARLITETTAFLNEDIRLAGKAVAA